MSDTENIFVVMWRHWWIVFGMIVFALITAGVFILKSTPIYSSASRLYVEQNGPRIVGELEEGVMMGAHNYLNTQAVLIGATPIVSEAVQSLDIPHMNTFANVDNPVQCIKQSMSVSVGKEDGLINVSFRGAYPEENAQVVNAVVQAYFDFHSSRKRSTAMDVLKIIQKEKAKRSPTLIEKQRAMIEFKDQHEELIFQTEQGNMILEQLQVLSAAISEAPIVTLECKTRYEAAQRLQADPEGLMQLINAQQVPGQTMSVDTELVQLRSSCDELKRQRADRTQLLMENHPGVVALDREIDKLESQMQDHLAQYAETQVSLLEQQYKAAQEKEKQLMESFEGYRQQAATLDRYIDQYALLESDWHQTKQLCDILDTRIKELSVTEDVDALNITILEVAHAAERPSFPDRRRVMAIGLVMGVVAGGGSALIWDMMDRRVRSANDASSLLGVPLLGIIPSMSRKLSSIERGQIIIHDSTSHVAEAFRTIRTALFFSTSYDQARVIQIASACASEGKSTFLSNLAISMALNGHRVLVIDADMRRPTQSRIFSMEHKPGITSILRRLCPLREVIWQTDTKGLDIIPCDTKVPNPTEMLNSPMFKAMLVKLKSRYDRIIVDSPPILPVADGCILAAVCDATIFVTRASVTMQKSLLRAKAMLAGIEGQIIGVVMNDMNKGEAGYGKYEYQSKPEENVTSTDSKEGVHVERDLYVAKTIELKKCANKLRIKNDNDAHKQTIA